MEIGNDIFFSVISGMNIVVGVAMIYLLISGPTKDWADLKKFGFFTMALGLIGQAVYVINGTSLHDPFWDQLWVLKDIGLAIFTASLINTWINKTKL